MSPTAKAKLPFQAIRAFLNEELEELRKTLEVSRLLPETSGF